MSAIHTHTPLSEALLQHGWHFDDLETEWNLQTSAGVAQLRWIE